MKTGFLENNKTKLFTAIIKLSIFIFLVISNYEDTVVFSWGTSDYGLDWGTSSYGSGSNWGTSGYNSGLSWGTSDYNSGMDWGTSGYNSGLNWGTSDYNSGLNWGTSGYNSGLSWGTSDYNSGLDWGTSDYNSGLSWGTSDYNSGLNWGTSDYNSGLDWGASDYNSSLNWGTSDYNSGLNWGTSDYNSGLDWGASDYNSGLNWGTSDYNSGLNWGTSDYNSGLSWGTSDYPVDSGWGTDGEVLITDSGLVIWSDAIGDYYYYYMPGYYTQSANIYGWTDSGYSGSGYIIPRRSGSTYSYPINYSSPAASRTTVSRPIGRDTTERVVYDGRPQRDGDIIVSSSGTVRTQPLGEPASLSSVYLNQVPYTGPEDVLKIIGFISFIIIWSAAIGFYFLKDKKKKDFSRKVEAFKKRNRFSPLVE